MNSQWVMAVLGDIQGHNLGQGSTLLSSRCEERDSAVSCEEVTVPPAGGTSKFLGLERTDVGDRPQHPQSPGTQPRLLLL